VIVVPSRAEAMPYIVLEALAARKDMIATSVGGIPEIFSPQSPALVSPSSQSVEKAMVSAIRDPERFAANMPPREELKAKFSARVMARDIENTYVEALGRQS